MRQVNLISLLNAYRTLPTVTFDRFLNYHGFSIKKDELEDLSIMVKELLEIKRNQYLYDNFFVSFKIDQIPKEFDLLRIDGATIVNIEIKRESTVEEITKQLIKNKYYLSFLNKDMNLFTYISSIKKVYRLTDKDKLATSSLETICEKLTHQDEQDIPDIKKLFKPSNYLVSPFNSTKEFLKNEYFLTSHQIEIKDKIIKHFSKNEHRITGVTGKPGTGKTLLTYDIARTLNESSKVLIIHCGILNPGHANLKFDHKWNILGIGTMKESSLTGHDVLIVDETQRISENQFNIIIQYVKKNKIKCVFSYDPEQTLTNKETYVNIPSKIENEVTLEVFKLTEKIRTNPEIANFMKCLFNKGRQINKSINYSNIEIKYFSTNKMVKSYLGHLNSTDWKVINYTGATINRTKYEYEEFSATAVTDNAHRVLGQEYDNVVAVIDKHFYYQNNNLDNRQKQQYDMTKMLYQIMTRTRIKLQVVIIRNEEILKRCLDIVDK